MEIELKMCYTDNIRMINYLINQKKVYLFLKCDKKYNKEVSFK